MFSPFQKKIIAGALTGLAIVVLIALVVGTIGVSLKFIAAFNTVIWPLVIASLLAVLLQPICDFLESRLRFPRALAIFSLFVLLAVGLAGILFWLVPVIFRQATEFIQHIPTLWAQLLENCPDFAEWIEERLEDGGLIERIRENQQLGAHLKTLASAALPKMQQLWIKAESFYSMRPELLLEPCSDQS